MAAFLTTPTSAQCAPAATDDVQVSLDGALDGGKTFFSQEEQARLRGPEFRFENLVLEGGGAKGIAYVGVLEELQDRGMLDNFKRFAGVSMGSVIAALLAVNVSPKNIHKLTSSMDEKCFLDAGSFKYFRLLPNLLWRYGWHPGSIFFQRMGEAFQAQGFDPQLTFGQLYHLTGRELCVVSANLSTSSVEYFHPKTTPDFPILKAVAMSVAIPVVLQPKRVEVNGRLALFVDGGVMNNFPIDCFDGWFLSMDPAHCFLRSREGELGQWFKGYNPKTLGAMVFSAEEKEILKDRFQARLAKFPKHLRPKRPTDTILSRKRKNHGKAVKKEKVDLKIVTKARQDFASCLSPRNLNAITRDELLSSLKTLQGQDYGNSYEVLFGQRAPVETFREMEAFNKRMWESWSGSRQAIQDNADSSTGTMSNHVVASFLASKGKRAHHQNQETQTREVGDFKDFLLALMTALTFRHKQLSVTPKDFERTIGIHCDYVTTMDTLEDADVNFLVAQGRMATQAFLKERLEKIEVPQKVK